MCVIKISWENLQLPQDYSFMIWLVLLGIWPRESVFSRQVERRRGFRSSVMPSSFYSCVQAEYSFSLAFVREFSVFPPLFCLSPSQFFFSDLLLPNGFCLSTSLPLCLSPQCSPLHALCASCCEWLPSRNVLCSFKPLRLCTCFAFCLEWPAFSL